MLIKRCFTSIIHFLDLSVAAYVIPAKLRDNAAFGNQTYFGRMGIRLGKDRFLTLTTEAVVINDAGFSLGWDEELAMRIGEFVVALDGKRHVVVSRGEDVVVVAMLHRVGGRQGRAPAASHRVDHLGLYVHEGKGLSERVHGLMGEYWKRFLATVHSAHTPRHSHTRCKDFTLFTRLMDDIQILIVHSRGVYSFMAMILVALLSLTFLLLSRPIYSPTFFSKIGFGLIKKIGHILPMCIKYALKDH